MNRKLEEDNNGFTFFPIEGGDINRLESGKTLVYLIAFDLMDLSNSAYILSNSRLIKKGEIVSDDIVTNLKSDVVDNVYEDIYFPNINLGELMSIPLCSCICIGWSEYTFKYKNGHFWFASFRDLTSEGKKLYYSIKKLHNNKEVRILTFNNI